MAAITICSDFGAQKNKVSCCFFYYVLCIIMYGCESCTVKKAERRRIDAFELWCWRRLLRVPWTARISNQSILKKISPGSSLEGLMLKVKLQYFCHLMWRADSLEKTLMLGKIEGRRHGDPESEHISSGSLAAEFHTGQPGTGLLPIQCQRPD